MVHLDAFHHLSDDGVIIDILVFFPFVDDILDFFDSGLEFSVLAFAFTDRCDSFCELVDLRGDVLELIFICLLYTSDAADE